MGDFIGVIYSRAKKEFSVILFSCTILFVSLLASITVFFYLLVIDSYPLNAQCRQDQSCYQEHLWMQNRHDRHGKCKTDMTT